MAPFLTDAWLADVDEALAAAPRPRGLGPGDRLVIQHTVTGGPDGDRVWHLEIGDLGARLHAGPAPSADVWFSEDHDTAVGVASGRLGATMAVLSGRLRVGGDLKRILAAPEILADIDEALAGVRARTTFPRPDERAGAPGAA
ncbi:MAG: SCP2 sterol-binding domain-containing protein [Acidimicrobiales bacterium]|nr:SCP2 sterol-binding domain-containing protein [Acidimicrobiales bacterium]